MTVYMIWNGGSGYGCGELDDLEEFETLAAARQAFTERATTFDAYYPCVEHDTPDNGGPTAWLYMDKPTDPDAYPDRVLEFGPRGGLVERRA